VQPLAAAFSLVDPALIEASSVLGASSLRTFLRVILPLSVPGVITAAVLTFAHKLGEFGVVLMVGGNLPGITRTVSVAIYDEVQSFDFATAHATALVVLLFAFTMLAIVYAVNRRPWSVPYRP
jgi:molybdate transport system permease protein